MRRALIASFVAFAALWMAGCPKGTSDYKVGRKAEIVGDYDTAVISFDKALKRDPLNAEYKLHDMRAHFEAGQFHVEQGNKALNEGHLEEALGEFQKAEAIDPSSAIAQQDAQKAEDLLAKLKQEQAPKPVGTEEPEDLNLMSAPPKLKPLSQNTINLKMGPSDARVVFNTIGQLAGLSVIFDPSFVSRSINVDLPNVTLEQALDAVSLSAGAFWKPVTSNIILVATDNLQTRRNLEDEEVQTFYLRNATTPQEVTETATLLRTLLDLTHMAQLADQSAIVIRATPDKLMLASKIIDSLDKPKPEVVLQVDVLEARVDHERNLGIQPGQSATLAFTPRSSIQPNGGNNNNNNGTGTTGTTNTTPQVTLNNLHHLSTGDYSVTLPGATLNALLNDSTTRIIQDPSIRIVDGATAKLLIGDRVPIATGSFQAGVGVGVSGGAGLVNPLVNTQFQYQDVGVNVEVTPRVHPDGDVSLKLDVNVSSVTGQSNIGGIQQPIISQRHLGPDEIRLKDGEVSILGGLITRSEVKSLSGWPGLARIPFLRYFFSSEDKTSEDDEVLIALTPHVVRLPSISAEDLRTLASGTDANVRVYEQNVEQPASQKGAAPAAAAPSTGATPNSQNQEPAAGGAATLSFQPENISLKTGGTTTVNLLVNNVHDLFSIPLLLQYNPAVIQVEDIKNGGFLSGGTQEIAIVHQENPQQGQAVVSATRKPNTPGISGTGALIGIVIRAIGPGTSPLQVLQVNARDSKQQAIALTSSAATIQVQQ